MTNLKQIVSTHFTIIPDRCTEEEIVFVCPEPACGDSSGNRSVNTKSLLTNCWRCSIGGKFTTWAKKIGVPIEDTGPEITDEAWENAVGLLYSQRKPMAFNDAKLPQGFTPLSQEPACGYARLIESMAQRKNLELKDFIQAGAGFTRTDEKWEPYCIFPVQEYGELVYFQGRKYNESPGEPNKLFPDRREFPMGSRHWVYNADAMRKPAAKVAVIVESILNVLSLHKLLSSWGETEIIPIAVFKHAVSKEQLKKILAPKNIQEICIMFDSDATDSAWKFLEEIRNLRKATVAEMPEGIDANDDSEKAMKAFSERTSERRKVFFIV